MGQVALLDNNRSWPICSNVAMPSLVALSLDWATLLLYFVERCHAKPKATFDTHTCAAAHIVAPFSANGMT